MVVANVDNLVVAGTHSLLSLSIALIINYTCCGLKSIMTIVFEKKIFRSATSALMGLIIYCTTTIYITILVVVIRRQHRNFAPIGELLD